MKRYIWVLLILLAIFPLSALYGREKFVGNTIIKLPQADMSGELSFEQLLLKGSEFKGFRDEQLQSSDISQLAWAGQGIVDSETGRRTVDSRDGVYPAELNFLNKDGVFVYVPEEHHLEQRFNQDVRDRLGRVGYGNKILETSPCVIVIAGSTKEIIAKYGARGKAVLGYKIGRIARNIELQAASIGLSVLGVNQFNSGQLRKLCRLSPRSEPMYVMCIGYPELEVETPAEIEKPVLVEPVKKQVDNEKAKVAEKTAEVKVEGNVKRVVLIAGSRGFRDEELFRTQDELKKAGIETDIASSKIGQIVGTFKGKAEATLLVKDVDVSKYDAVVFVGGSGAKEFFNDNSALKLVRDAVRQKKVVGAICLAPSILANSGIFRGRRLTAFMSEKKNIESAGAQYTGNLIERDGLVITAKVPEASRNFGEAIAKAVLGKED